MHFSREIGAISRAVIPHAVYFRAKAIATLSVLPHRSPNFQEKYAKAHSAFHLRGHGVQPGFAPSNASAIGRRNYL
jgi:hypothetical protein